MKLLFVNACPRGGESRTLRLARNFLDEMAGCLHGLEIVEHDLCSMNLPPVTGPVLEKREAFCNACDWSDAMIRPAKDFVSADAVLIAAPYWDLSFPSVLKIWVEHMYVRNLTFHYEDDRCVGHCRAGRAVYITTAGSPIGENDWGALYMQAVMKALGIPAFTSLRAEALDLDSSDVDEIMSKAEEEIRDAARLLAAELRG